MYLLSIVSFIWIPFIIFVVSPIKRTYSDDDFIITDLSECDQYALAEHEYTHEY